MIEIELPCCGTATYLAELTDFIECDGCNVVLELADPKPVGVELPLAA